MPRSLNNADIAVVKSVSYNAQTTNEIKSSKLTNKMVNDALINLHSFKGVSLKAIYNYILSNYNLETITNNRKLLIKKHITNLKESEDIENKTGKGFVGCLKLKDKQKFLRKIKAEEKQRKPHKSRKVAGNKKEKKAKKAAEHSSTIATGKMSSKNTFEEAATTSNANVKKVVKRKIKKQIIPSNLPAPVVPRQTTPVTHSYVDNGSIFDTPMLPSQVRASTPFLESVNILNAPAKREKANRKRVLHPKNCGDTPRSSLSGKKRRIQKRGK